tara:strand:- start:3973 stop:4929 length:957 start_codon:yes stop_codon:yes gene_type:complete
MPYPPYTAITLGSSDLDNKIRSIQAKQSLPNEVGFIDKSGLHISLAVINGKLTESESAKYEDIIKTVSARYLPIESIKTGSVSATKEGYVKLSLDITDSSTMKLNLMIQEIESELEKANIKYHKKSDAPHITIVKPIKFGVFQGVPIEINPDLQAGLSGQLIDLSLSTISMMASVAGQPYAAQVQKEIAPVSKDQGLGGAIMSVAYQAQATSQPKPFILRDSAGDNKVNKVTVVNNPDNVRGYKIEGENVDGEYRAITVYNNGTLENYNGLKITDPTNELGNVALQMYKNVSDIIAHFLPLENVQIPGVSKPKSLAKF